MWTNRRPKFKLILASVKICSKDTSNEELLLWWFSELLYKNYIDYLRMASNIQIL